MIKNIIFDVGKVLVYFEPAQHLKNLGYDEATRTAVMDAVFGNPMWDENDRGSMSPAEFEEAFVANAPEYEMQIREAFQTVEGTIDLLPHSLEWVQEMKARGYHLYILSNYGEHTLDKTKHKLKFLPYMDGVIFSYEYKVIKPEREIYEILLRKFGLDPEECVFIDDRKENLKTAEEFGIRGILFQTYEQARDELDQMLRSS